jgi:hypothetical protein
MYLAAEHLFCACALPCTPYFILDPLSPQELDAIARDWTKPPPDALFTLRVPIEYASLHAAVSVHIRRWAIYADLRVSGLCLVLIFM